MVSALLSRCLILILGTLYPAYRSYKAIKNRDVKEHVKWMMYWIVFALFTTLETFLDIFFSWFPFYYEIKILFILWVLSPATRGSSLLYKKVVHPLLIAREKEIDELIEKTKQQGYSTFLQLFSSGFHYASNLFLHSAVKGQSLLGSQLRKSLSLNDVYDEDLNGAPTPAGPLVGSAASEGQQMYLKKTHETINEEEEDHSDFDPEGDRYRKSLYASQLSNGSGRTFRAPPRQTFNGNNIRDYDIIDDDDFEHRHLLNGGGKPTSVSTNGVNGSGRRRASSKQMTGTGTTTGSSAAGGVSNYKSNEDLTTADIEYYLGDY